MKTKNTTRLEHSAGGYKSIRLRWLRLYMNASGESIPEIAAKVGMSRQSFWHLVIVDDCKLSRAESIMDALGYKFDIAIMRNDEYDADDIEFIPTAEELESIKKRNRMAFIRDAMQSYGYTVESLTKAMNESGHPISMSTIANYSGYVDDIYLSRVYELAEAMGAKVKINITKKQD